MVLRTDNDCTTICSQPCQTTLPRIFLQKNVAGGFAVSIRQSPPVRQRNLPLSEGIQYLRNQAKENKNENKSENNS